MFSRAARLRMLKWIGAVDWPAALPALFITLTYQHTDEPWTRDRLNQDRSVFARYMEDHLGRNAPFLWRVEWKKRKSGRHRGIYYPHHHLLAFNVRYIPWQRVREYWRKTIGARGKLVTDVEGVRSFKKAAVYIAKYQAKQDDSLDYAAYVNTVPSHYHWGVRRKDEVPVHPIEEITLEDKDLLEELLRICRQWYPASKDMQDGFTILGNAAYQAGREIFSDFL